jgi:hypothetical protein
MQPAALGVLARRLSVNDPGVGTGGGPSRRADAERYFISYSHE